MKAQWPGWHHRNYRPWPANQYNPGGRTWCEAEEFPMDSLEEASGPQVIRQVDGIENGLQGRIPLLTCLASSLSDFQQEETGVISSELQSTLASRSWD
jgi:hypothetical protein